MTDISSIPSLNSKSNITFKQKSSIPINDNVSFNATPDISAETITDSVTSAPLAGKVMEMHEIPTEVLVPTTAGVWLGSNYLVDKLNNNLSKDYSETFYGKVAQKCDNFSANNWLGKKLQAGVDLTGQKIDKIATKSAIVRSLKNFSTRPEWGFAKFPFYGLKGFLGMDLTTNVFDTCTSSIVSDSFLGKLTNPIKYEKLLDVGFSLDEVKTFEEGLKGKSSSKKAIATLEKYLTKIGVTPNEIQSAINGLSNDKDVIKKLKEIEETANITKRLGFLNVDHYKAFLKTAQDKPDEVMRVLDILKRANPNAKMSHWQPYKFFGSTTLGKIVGSIAGRKSSWGEYANKYKVAMGNGAKSFLGKTATKSLAWLQEAFTGRFAFGKLFAIMAAVEVSKALIHTVKADGIKEKFKTGAERITDLIATAVSMTAAMIGMHKIGGFKYIGLKDKAEVDAYRQAVEDLNTRNKAGIFKGNKALFKAEAKKVRDLLHPERIKNPINKLLFLAGRLINSGNEKVVSYVGTSTIMNILRKCANSNIIGVPLRIWLGAVVLSGWVTKAILGTEHKIFGKPKFSVEDEEKIEENENLVDENKQNATNTSTRSPETYKSDSNLIKKAALNKQSNANNSQNTNTQTNNSPIESNLATSTDVEVEPKRTYIPSSTPFVATEINSTDEIENVLMNADNTEKEISELISSLNKSY